MTGQYHLSRWLHPPCPADSGPLATLCSLSFDFEFSRECGTGSPRLAQYCNRCCFCQYLVGRCRFETPLSTHRMHWPLSSPAPTAISSPHPLPSRPVYGFGHVRQIAYRRSSSPLSVVDEADRRAALYASQKSKDGWCCSLALHATRHICSQSLAPKTLPHWKCLEYLITWGIGATR
ncbi:hypothetical protein HDV63DRAFT_215818 [Trichoderma sp. SZMC 28014]